MRRAILSSTARALLCALVALGLLTSSTASAAAGTGGPQWAITALPGPTNLPPGSSGDEYVITATNTGGESTNGTTITLSDHLPAGVSATAVEGSYMGENVSLSFPAMSCTSAEELEKGVSPVECTYSGAVAPGMQLRVVISVDVAANAPPSLIDEAAVAGGGAKEASVSQPASVSSTPAGFGIAPGSLYTALSSVQAGAHPNFTTSFAFAEAETNVPAGAPKDLEIELPVGFAGNATAVPKCTIDRVISFTCPADTAVGSATVFVNEVGTNRAEPFVALVYNIEPQAGEPAAFAFSILGIGNVRLDTGVRSNGEYNVRVSIADVSESERLVSSTVTLWGVPADENGPGPSQTADQNEVSFGGPGGGNPVPFLANPTQCGTVSALEIAMDSWQSPGVFTTPDSASFGPMTGCEALSFDPSLTLTPDDFQAGAPAGYAVNLEVPQNEEPSGLATPDVRDAEVTLPEGSVISPSAANGLEACSEAQFELHSGSAGHCPQQSQIGSVKVTTPLLALPLEGHVYVGQPECSPCTPEDAQDGRMVPLLLEAAGSGVIVKLEGHTRIDQQSGRLTTVFTEDPQLPFSELTLSLKGGPDAPLANPSACGPAVATARLTPWSSLTATEAQAPAIAIEGCATPGFKPSLEAGMTKSAHGGSFSPFAVALAREDSEQTLGSVGMALPPGLEAMIATVSLCDEAQANAGTCPEASLVGTASSVVGRGSEPYVVSGGKVYLTGPYGGGSFGLSIVVPAEAGPFRLSGLTGTGGQGDGTVVVRAAIIIDPHTAQVSVVTNKLPTQLDGVPLDIRKVIVDIDREGFTFNPTNCDALSVSGTISSSTGTTADVSYPFQANDCASLPFTPGFSVDTNAHHSRRDGDSLHVLVTSGQGQANIAKVHVTLPKKLPSRDSTLGHACTEAQFAKSPEGCPALSKVGTATAYTPVLPVPLTGPAILVSHGGLKFPDLDVVLKGYGVTVVLTGHTDIHGAFTSSTFEGLPDVPVRRFELNLPAGEDSLIGAPENLCSRPAGKARRRKAARLERRLREARGAQRRRLEKRVRKLTARVPVRLSMPTTITGQNGAVKEQETLVHVERCPRLTHGRLAAGGGRDAAVDGGAHRPLRRRGA